ARAARLDLGDHAVECSSQIGEFVAPALVDADAQIAGADLARGPRQLADPPRHPLRQEDAHADGGEDRDAEQRREGEDVALLVRLPTLLDATIGVHEAAHFVVLVEGSPGGREHRVELVSRWAREVVEEPWRRLTLQARGVLPLLALEGTFDRISLCVRTLCVRSLRVRAALCFWALCFWARCLWPRRAWALCTRALTVQTVEALCLLRARVTSKGAAYRELFLGVRVDGRAPIHADEDLALGVDDDEGDGVVVHLEVSLQVPPSGPDVACLHRLAQRRIEGHRRGPRAHARFDRVRQLLIQLEGLIQTLPHLGHEEAGRGLAHRRLHEADGDEHRQERGEHDGQREPATDSTPGPHAGILPTSASKRSEGVASQRIPLGSGRLLEQG